MIRLAVVVLLVATCTRLTTATTASTLYAALPAVVDIEGPGCTGVVALSPWIVLTAKHCVQATDAAAPVDAASLTVRIGERRLHVWALSTSAGAYSVDLRGALDGRDVAALLLAEPAPVTPARLALDALPEAGDLVVFASRHRVQAGVARVTAADSRRVVTEALTCAGDSGGPLFDLHGRVLALASLRTSGPCGRGPSLFTPIGALDALAHD